MSVVSELPERPQSPTEAVLGVLLAILIAFTFRLALGLLLGDPIHPVTVVALVGGGIGAFAMGIIMRQVSPDVEMPATQFWGRHIADDDPAKYRVQGQTWHVVYGAIMGSFQPRIYRKILDVHGRIFAALPLSLLTGLAFGIAVMLLGVVFARAGLFDLDMNTESLTGFLALHVVYGLVLGFFVGLWLPVIKPLTGL